MLSKGTCLISKSSIDNLDSIDAHFLRILVTGDYYSSAPEMAITLLFIQRRILLLSVYFLSMKNKIKPFLTSISGWPIKLDVIWFYLLLYLNTLA